MNARTTSVSGGTGSVVTAAGLVFALTMCSMVVSDLRVIGQMGTTIGLGLLFATPARMLTAQGTPSVWKYGIRVKVRQ